MSASKSVRDDRRLLDKELMTDFLARVLAIFDAFVLERMLITLGHALFLQGTESDGV